MECAKNVLRKHTTNIIYILASLAINKNHLVYKYKQFVFCQMLSPENNRQNNLIRNKKLSITFSFV